MEENKSNDVITPWSMKFSEEGLDKDKYACEHPSNNIELVTPAIATLGKGDYNNNLANIMPILQDILAGDPAARNRPEFKALNFPAMEKALEWLIKTDQLSNTGKIDLFENAWRLNFKRRPPTIEEFLTRKYIGEQAPALNKFVKSTLIEFYNGMSPYRDLVLSLCTGAGKALTLDERVWVDKDTYKQNGELQVGDKILSADGETQQEVVAIADWDSDEIYELELEDGRKIKCGQHHLHHVSYRKDSEGNPIWEDVETLFILNHPELDFDFQVV